MASPRYVHITIVLKVTWQYIFFRIWKLLSPGVGSGFPTRVSILLGRSGLWGRPLLLADGGRACRSSATFRWAASSLRVWAARQAATLHRSPGQTCCLVPSFPLPYFCMDIVNCKGNGLGVMEEGKGGRGHQVMEKGAGWKEVTGVSWLWKAN